MDNEHKALEQALQAASDAFDDNPTADNNAALCAANEALGEWERENG